ncbi:MAG: zinc ribbon domain-containing protein [Lachnospiraceae bacterium]|nr:zinc ribbon domain-containing protein [Lachnospiraceae bacterium]
MLNYYKSEKFIRLYGYGMGPYAMRKIKVCAKCGQIASHRSWVCPSCKRLLTGDTLFRYYKAMHAHCPSCDVLLTKDAQYCPQCGRKVAP